MDLGLDKILQLTPEFWMQDIGGKIRKRVKDDALKGIMQNDTQGHQYRSQQYKRYKANRMEYLRRGNANTKSKSQGKIKAYKSVDIQSNETAFVNMILTGHLINGLHPTRADKHGVTMSFSPKDTKKLIGNRARGYDVSGLNEVNRDWVKEEILKQFDKNKRKYLRKAIVIEIG